MTKNKALLEWVDEMAKLCQPDQIVWCDGSEEEKARLEAESFSTGELIKLNENDWPGCVYHRTAENDVARVEGRTFICTNKEEDAGPTNNWMAPADAYKMLTPLFAGSMKGRTMYVVPFIMGHPGSPFSKIGVELTDSIYVVLNMRIMTRMGKIALDELGENGEFTKCLHGKADIDMEKRYIVHFPEDNTIWSVNSGYGGNVLLGKKCLALRIASFLGHKEGWMAEHMLIMGIEDKKGNKRYVAAAFPSACGKTNLAMLIPPEGLEAEGYKVTTIGDDIAWLRIGEDGRLWAVNPEAGFFGVVPGTNMKTNPNAMKTIRRGTIFTNVVECPNECVWWEGADEKPPASGGKDWKGNPWTPDSPDKGAHPNSRFTAPARNCPVIDPDWEDPKGVPISAIIFGGRRAKIGPLIFESFDWQHGTFLGATMASETTAAATGKVGVVRRDPMAMRPFIGYNVGDYLQHWLDMGKKIPNPPKIFQVNWFRTDDGGKFRWPGFGENLRAIVWALSRCEDKVGANETPIGHLPTLEEFDTHLLEIGPKDFHAILNVQKAEWEKEIPMIEEHLTNIGDRCPKEMWDEFKALKKRLGVN